MNLIKSMIKNNDVQKLVEYMQENNLILDGNKIVAKNNDVKLKLKSEQHFYDQRQLIKKILLNS